MGNCSPASLTLPRPGWIDEGSNQVIGDAYTRRARVYPALLVVLPLTTTGILFGITALPWWSSVSALVVGSGLWVLLAEVGRHLGKKKEPALFKVWTGPPTTTLLRHTNSSNPVRLQRLHRSLEGLTGLTFPTAEEEASDSAAADAVYEAATDDLRDRTRDSDEFPLVFDELCNYGFRRNLWGLRTWGITLALGTAVAVLVMWWMRVGQAGAMSLPMIGGLVVLNLLVALGWYLWVTTDWVRQPATAYAERLLESAIRLQRIG